MEIYQEELLLSAHHIYITNFLDQKQILAMWLSRKWIGLGKPKFLSMGEAQVQRAIPSFQQMLELDNKVPPFSALLIVKRSKRVHRVS